MKQNLLLKTGILALIVLLLVSLVLMLFGKLDPLYFWILIILSAVFAYWILPKLGK